MFYSRAANTTAESTRPITVDTENENVDNIREIRKRCLDFRMLRLKIPFIVFTCN